ncbi:MAG: glycogen-binding domain-containing protein [Victivallaceae bacterium]|nr:glycogen-binding domain-containing protein [Victivallaceae bacterium]
MYTIVEKIGNSKKRVSLSLDSQPGHCVKLAGSFNDWDPESSPMPEKAAGHYAVTLELAPGYYEYKFVIDGEWVLDDGNSNFASNDFGTLNSVLQLD